MIKLKFIACGIASYLFLNGCSEILQPVTLLASKQDYKIRDVQEEFEINIETLTFKNAKKANNAPYPRQLILTGSGSKANVQNETNFLKSNFPMTSKGSDYLIGIGDNLLFTKLNEFEPVSPQWPSAAEKSEYLLGAGDQLNFIQSNDNKENIKFDNETSINDAQVTDSIISTQGIIGSNGNILLFGLGNILAANRSLDDVRTEVRNILIRNGLAPNFQLEISNFQSQKAFVTSSDGSSEIIPLTNLPISLKEVALRAGLYESHKNFALIRLTRDDQELRVTAGQLFDPKSPEIIIQDKDQIEIQIILDRSTNFQSVVGSKGNILIPDVGSIYAFNRTVDDIYNEISSILIAKGIKPSFQVELTEFVSKKAYLIQKNNGSIVIPLTSSKITLRELILANKSSVASTLGLSIITLKRNKQVFRMTGDQLLDPSTPDIWVVDEDQIEVESLAYKPGKVFALSGAGNASIVPISPSTRETLADILFARDGALNNLLAKRSEVYLLRGPSPSTAYHLDAQNVSSILVAAKTELRPNDIIYVADRPIVSFSRTLAELLPLRILLRDIQEDNIP